MDIYFSIPTKPKFFCNLGVSWSGLKIEAEHIEANYYFNEGTYYQFPQLNLGLMYNAHYWQTKNSNFAFRINGGYSIATSKASLNSNYTMTDHKGTSFSNFFLSLQFYTWNKRKI